MLTLNKCCQSESQIIMYYMQTHFITISLSYSVTRFYFQIISHQSIPSKAIGLQRLSQFIVFNVQNASSVTKLLSEIILQVEIAKDVQIEMNISGLWRHVMQSKAKARLQLHLSSTTFTTVCSKWVPHRTVQFQYRGFAHTLNKPL